MLTENKHEHSREEHRSLCFYARVEIQSAQRLHYVDVVLLISCELQYFIFKGSNGLTYEFSHDEKTKTEFFKKHSSCSSASMVSCFMGPLQVNVSNNQSVFQTNVWAST